jgi:hypothetical protein
MAFKAIAEQTSGDFSLMERTLPPNGRRPLPHICLIGTICHAPGRTATT